MGIARAVLPWWGPLVMSDTPTLQPLQLQGRRHGLCSVPCTDLSFSPHLPCGSGQRKKEQTAKVSPLGVCTWAEGLVCLVTFISISLGRTGSDGIKCPLSVSGSSRQAVVSVGLRHFTQIHIRCLKKSSVARAAAASLRSGCEPSNESASSWPLHPLPDPQPTPIVGCMSPSSDRQTEASLGSTQAASAAHPY